MGGVFASGEEAKDGECILGDEQKVNHIAFVVTEECFEQSEKCLFLENFS